MNGVKNLTWLHLFSNFDLVNEIAIDYMHGIGLGAMKLLMKLWFLESLKKQPFSIHDKLGQVDERLEKIKPTIEISRPPRSYSKYGANWKASEFRNFLLYFGIPVLADILPSIQLANFSLLSHSIFTLLKRNISKDDIKRTEEALQKFCQQFEKIYGERYMLMNIHQLLHLCDNVVQLGPLWTHCCFPFEDKNRFILKTIHGSQKIECQLQSAVNMMHSIPEIIHEKISKNEILMKFYMNMNKYKYNYSQLGSNETKISENIFVLGAINSIKMDITLYSMLTAYFGVPPSPKIQEFH